MALEKKEKPKFDPRKVDMTAKALSEVAAAIKRYEDIWQTLSQQERAVVGGIVFNLVCIWSDFSLMGALADRPVGATLINSLANFFNNPPPKRRSGLLPPATPVRGGQDFRPN